MNSREICAAVRLPLDAPNSQERIACGQVNSLRQFLHEDLLVSVSTVPRVYADLQTVRQRLGFSNVEIQAFVFASPFYQAECYPAGNANGILRISSSLVEALSSAELQFVIAHELGHLIFSHMETTRANDGDIESLVTHRYRELSCDRVGLLGSRSLQASVAAMMKTVSGLSERHLRIDVATFIRQIQQLDSSAAVGDAPHTASHPTFLIRCRALLWFSMNKVFDDNDGLIDNVHLEKINLRIEQEITNYIDSPLKKIISDARQDYELWLVAAAVAKSGGFSRRQQALFETHFGSELLEKLKAFLSALSSEEAVREALDRLEGAEAIFRRVAPIAYSISNQQSAHLVSQFL